MAFTTINKSSLHFNTKLFTGTGSSNAITGVGFQPDLVWIKNRATTGNHALFDVINGVTKYVNSNTNYGLQTSAQTLTAFGADGFTVGTSADLNGNGNNIASWNWKAGGTASTNNDGDNACSLSANATAGFSISTHTVPNVGAGQYTIGHGLGKKPKCVITKQISTTGNFQTYFEGIGTENQQYLQLNSTAALANHSGLWGNGMTTSVVGLSNTALSSGTTAITYSFAEITGYSKIGTYTGNGNVDGTFLYTGFKPAWILFKEASQSGQSWYIWDTTRDDNGNPLEEYIAVDGNAAEGGSGSTYMDYNSNGVKMRDTGTYLNGSGQTYVYMAFAEAPLVGTNNVPCTAR